MGLLAGCQNPSRVAGGGATASSSFQGAPSDAFKDYWFQGVAELSTYTLDQSRYRDVHPGEVVLLFVTEDFRTDKQVKDEGGDAPDGTSVLKTNLLRRFTTGLYDYSVMTSVFTPIEASTFPHTLKVTHSSQDWCGQSFLQVNLEPNRYRVQAFSYFEQEGDENYTAAPVPLEDELFNRLRLDPDQLPTGKFEMYPSATFSRFDHSPFRPYPAEGSLDPYQGQDFAGSDLRAYTVVYPQLDRRLTLVFESAFPYRIEGWIESDSGGGRRTVARRRQTRMEPYWRLNGAEDRPLRDSLQVTGL